MLDDLLNPPSNRPHALKTIARGRTEFQLTSNDAEIDLRLARYFRMSEGFFLGLQPDYELIEAKRALNGDLDLIVPRAA